MFLPKKQLNDWLSHFHVLPSINKDFKVHEDTKVEEGKDRISGE